MIDRIKRIAEENGFQLVCEKTKEECEELIYAIETNDEKNILDEIADVQIMLHELSMVYGISREDILSRMEYKIKRTEKRLKIGGETNE